MRTRASASIRASCPGGATGTAKAGAVSSTSSTPRAHGSIEADAIVCRHTLEHIQPTREFIQTVRDSIGDRLDTLVFLEIPDQERVYDERAFWDIYYEHCSYFTQGALERVFLDCGFEILDSWKGFGDQYLLIEARPLAPGQAPFLPSSGEPGSAMRAKVRGFADDAPRVIAGWRDRFSRWQGDGKRVVIWGAGSKGVAFLTTLGVGKRWGTRSTSIPTSTAITCPGRDTRSSHPSRCRTTGPMSSSS